MCYSGIHLIILYIVFRTIIQILFKYVAIGPGGSSYFALLFEPLFYLAGIIFIAQAVVWLMVLRRLALSVAYPFTSLTVITMLASGALFFGESITLGNIVGTVVIMTGVIIIAGDHSKENADNIGCS